MPSNNCSAPFTSKLEFSNGSECDVNISVWKVLDVVLLVLRCAHIAACLVVLRRKPTKRAKIVVLSNVVSSALFVPIQLLRAVLSWTPFDSWALLLLENLALGAVFQTLILFFFEWYHITLQASMRDTRKQLQHLSRIRVFEIVAAHLTSLSLAIAYAVAPPRPPSPASPSPSSRASSSSPTAPSPALYFWAPVLTLVVLGAAFVLPALRRMRSTIPAEQATLRRKIAALLAFFLPAFPAFFAISILMMSPAGPPLRRAARFALFLNATALQALLLLFYYRRRSKTRPVGAARGPTGGTSGGSSGRSGGGGRSGGRGGGGIAATTRAPSSQMSFAEGGGGGGGTAQRRQRRSASSSRQQSYDGGQRGRSSRQQSLDRGRGGGGGGGGDGGGGGGRWATPAASSLSLSVASGGGGGVGGGGGGSGGSAALANPGFPGSAAVPAAAAAQSQSQPQLLIVEEANPLLLEGEGEEAEGEGGGREV